VVNPKVAKVAPKLRKPADLQDEEEYLGRDVLEEAVEVQLDKLVLGSIDLQNEGG
jgi:hypothetical protein